MYIIELGVGVITPIILLSISRVRHSISGLFTAAAMVIGGVALNRINVFLIAYKPLYAEKTYFPSVFEIAVTLGLIATLVLVYRFIVMTFPVITVPLERKAGRARGSSQRRSRSETGEMKCQFNRL